MLVKVRSRAARAEGSRELRITWKQTMSAHRMLSGLRMVSLVQCSRCTSAGRFSRQLAALAWRQAIMMLL